MTEHTLTRTVSGSWTQTVSLDEEAPTYSGPTDLSEDVFIKAECTCGATFHRDDAAHEHLQEVTA